ncbi:tyrosine-type recombinase/integrase [Fusobacterium sp. PH5-44]|uniref:tyrosine-type recombinase/integrase n=1 Tax=unclassified Fusobacterium TaxID=2648384 RepID=UPI003D1A2848
MKKKMLFSELLDLWVTSKKVSVEIATFEEYKNQLVSISEYFAKKKVSEISIISLQQYYAFEMDRGLSANSIKHKHALIRPALNYAVNVLRIIDSNPAMYVELPKIKPYIPNTINPEIINLLLENEKDTPMEIPIFIAAVYGLRRSEIIGLKWSSIDFKNRVFTMENTIIRKRINGELINIERSYGKTATSHRQFPILDQFLELLSRIRKNQKEYRKNNPNYTTKFKDYLCLNERGELLLPDYVTYKFRMLLKKYAIKDVRFHDLRHSCATFLYNIGVQMKDMQMWLGHSSISTTLNIYTHLNYKNKEATAEKIKNSFFKNDKNKK